MKCQRPVFFNLESIKGQDIQPEQVELPDKLTDYLTGNEMPFSNRDNIRQKMLRFLIEEKAYLISDISVDREIKFEIEGQQILSLVDISVILNNKTLMVWKCSSGSLVSRERQIIASARLLEGYHVPFAVVANGKDLEFLDTSSEKVIGSGFQSIPSRQGLMEISQGLTLKPVNKKKLIYEQRILYTYDAISCPVTCKK